MIYYAEVAYQHGGGWAVRTTPEEALTAARRHVGATATTERASYVLEFPDDADPHPGSDVWGGWRANVRPIRVVSKRKALRTTPDKDPLGYDLAAPADANQAAATP